MFSTQRQHSSYCVRFKSSHCFQTTEASCKQVSQWLQISLSSRHSSGIERTIKPSVRVGALQWGGGGKFLFTCCINTLCIHCFFFFSTCMTHNSRGASQLGWPKGGIDVGVHVHASVTHHFSLTWRPTFWSVVYVCFLNIISCYMKIGS